MAQRAIIGINGDLLPFDETLDKIQTQAIGGGSVTWVPEADTRCVALTVTENGSKSASEEGVYGWNYVAVSVPGSSVTGIDPATGQETTVTVDPETGDIVKTVAPTEIRVTTPPTKTDYTEGETIDYSGIVVHAYSSNGQDMGAVPFGELYFSQKTAIQNESTYQPESATVEDTSDLYNNPPVNLPIVLGYGEIRKTADHNPEFWENTTIEIIESQDDVYGFCYGALEYEGFWIVLCSKEPFKFRIIKDIYNPYHTPPRWQTIDQYDIDQRMIHRKTGRYHYRTNGVKELQDQYRNTHFTTNGPCMWVDNLALSTDFINDTTEVVLYGTITPAGYAIPVQWQRPGDGAILETSFTINVTGGAA